MRSGQRLLPFLSACLGSLHGLRVSGPRPVDPTHLEWLLRGDWAMSLFAWLHVRDAPWSFPLGHQSGYLHPTGTSLAYADAVPWVGLLLKPFSSFLPRDFQYLGPWLLLCFVLQGWFGAKLVAELSRHRVHIVLGGALFVVAPVLAFRVGHLSLCAHWLVVAMTWLHLRPSDDVATARRTLLYALVLVVTAAGVHPYLFVMTNVLALALLVRLRGSALPRATLLLGALGIPAVGAAAFWALGFLSLAFSPGQGFDHYSSDLSALFNPGGSSRLFSGWSMGSGQYEGYGYLGAGILGIAAIAPFSGRSPDAPPLDWRRLAPLVIVALLFAVLSWSYTVTLGSHVVLTYRRLFLTFFEPIATTFRSPGRFIWPLHYVFILVVVGRLVRGPPHRASVVLALALAVQLVEINFTRASFENPPPLRTFALERWRTLVSGRSHLALAPVALRDAVSGGCEPTPFGDEEVIAFNWLAYRLGMTSNSGVTTRLDSRRAKQSCAELAGLTHAPRPDTLYVLHEGLTIAQSVREKLECRELDGHQVCVAVP